MIIRGSNKFYLKNEVSSGIYNGLSYHNRDRFLYSKDIKKKRGKKIIHERIKD